MKQQKFLEIACRVTVKQCLQREHPDQALSEHCRCEGEGGGAGPAQEVGGAGGEGGKAGSVGSAGDPGNAHRQ